VDYVLGADTHERIRDPLRGRDARVTGPGAFASCDVTRDLMVEGGRITEHAYPLLDVDPNQYPEDGAMKTLVAAARAPYRQDFAPPPCAAHTAPPRFSPL